MNRTAALPRSRNRRDTQIVASEETKQTKLLSEIVKYTKLSSSGMPPSVPDVPRLWLKRNKVHTMARTRNVGVISTTSTVAGTAAYTFALADLPNSSEISSLFDQYRILQVTVSITPTIPDSSVPIYTAIDYDDNNVPTGITSILEYETMQQSTGNIVTQRTLNPKTLSQLYNGIASTGYATNGPTWIDSSSPFIPHYGFKVFIPLTTGPTYTFQVVVDYVLQGRNPS